MPKGKISTTTFQNTLYHPNHRLNQPTNHLCQAQPEKHISQRACWPVGWGGLSGDDGGGQDADNV
ncbi:MAG: hypothetical protein GDA36_06555 [Rhodobacteraceae bacterium]|nr:hypothetical protein [Paracoccaceae bacterium]